MQISREGNRWLVSGDITMPYINNLLAESAALPWPDNIEVDLEAVSNVDTASISLLLEWQRQAVSQSVAINFRNLPENLVKLAKLYGVIDFIPQHSH